MTEPEAVSPENTLRNDIEIADFEIVDGGVNSETGEQVEWTHGAYEALPFRFPIFARFVLGTFGAGLAVLLITAAMLKPSTRGYGTHQQLGLPPCTFKVMFDGKPCPSCGMTTSWAHLTKGQIASSLRANPGGTLLGIVSILVSPWLVITAIKGTWFIGEPPTWLALTVGLSLLTVILGNWIIQMLK